MPDRWRHAPSHIALHTSHICFQSRRRAIAAQLARWDRALTRQHTETPLETSASPTLVHYLRVLSEVSGVGLVARGSLGASSGNFAAGQVHAFAMHVAVSMHDDGRWPPLHIPSWRAAPALASPRLRRPASWRCTAGTTLSCWRCWRRRRTAAGQVAGPLGTAPLTATRTRATTRTAPAAGAASSAGARGAMPGLQTSGLGESGACGPDEATCQPAARACACWSCCCRDSVSLLPTGIRAAAQKPRHLPNSACTQAGAQDAAEAAAGVPGQGRPGRGVPAARGGGPHVERGRRPPDGEPRPQQAAACRQAAASAHPQPAEARRVHGAAGGERGAARGGAPGAGRAPAARPQVGLGLGLWIGVLVQVRHSSLECWGAGPRLCRFEPWAPPPGSARAIDPHAQGRPACMGR